MFRGCTFKDQPVDGANDGGFYQEIFSKDGILWGCEMTTTNDSFTMQPGELIISGRVIWVDGATQIPFTSPIQNGYGQVLLTIDLSKTATKEEFDQIEASVVYSTTSLFPELTQGEINTSNGDMVYQQELAVVSIAGGNITGITRQIEGVEIDAERLGGQLPEYYLPAEKLAAVTNGTITATGMADPQHAYWQNRLGWVHLSVWWIAQAGQGAAIAQINGGNGLPNSAITVKGMVRYKDSGEVAMGLYRIDANGQIVVTNGAGAMMSEGWLDVTIPAKNV